MRVKSAVDWWLGGLLWLAVLAMTRMMFAFPAGEERIGYCVTIPFIAFLLSIYFCTYYELRDDHLFCRSGPFFERIPYDRIKSVRPSHSVLSGMALSLQRIEIQKHDSLLLGVTLISPPNREQFMRDLLSHCHNLG